MRRVPACLAAFLLISIASTTWGQGRFPLKAVPIGEAPPSLTASVAWDFPALGGRPALRGLPGGIAGNADFFCACLPGRTVVFVQESAGDRLWVDTNADGDLSDEKPLAGRASEDENSVRRIEFPPVTVRVGGAEIALKPVVVRDRDCGYCFLYLQPATVMAGTVRLGGRERSVYLIDESLDGKYTPWTPSGGERQDLLAVDLNGNGTVCEDGEEDERLPVPRLAHVGDAWYTVRVADDGSSIEFEKTEPKFGTLDIGDGSVDLEVTGESGVHHLSRAGTWRLPAGKYLIDDITASRNDADGKEWRLIQRVGAGIPSRVSFVIDAGKTLTLKLGSPLVLVPEVTREYEEVHIGLTAIGQAGEHYEPVPCHSDSDGFKMPTVKISNEAGEQLAAAAFEYG